MKRFSREILLLGAGVFEKLKDKRVLVVGLGGVGGYALENLARAGIGKLTIADGDRVDESNINRQIIALSSTVGRYKTEVFYERIKDINPSCEVTAFNEFYTADSSDKILRGGFDYCVDCFDSVNDKIHFITECKRRGYKIISALGAANRLNPEFKVCDIFSTKNDPFARKLRSQLKKAGVESLKTVFCDSPPSVRFEGKVLASISFSPALMGVTIAKEVINDLLTEINTNAGLN